MVREKILQSVYSAIDEINRQLSAEQKLNKAVDTILLGDNGKLDSLGIINFIVLTEQEIEKKIGAKIILTNIDALTQMKKYFRTVGSLVDYIALLLEVKNDGQATV